MLSKERKCEPWNYSSIVTISVRAELENPVEEEIQVNILRI